MQATPFLWGWGGFALWRWEVGLKVYPHSQEVLWKSSEEEHYLFDPVLLSLPSSALLPCQKQGTQMEEELGYHPAFQQLQDFNQSGIQLECKLGQEAQELARRYNDHRIKLAKKHKKKWAGIIQEGNTTFQEVFSMVSLIDSIKATANMCFLHSSLSLYEWCVGYCHATGQKCSIHCHSIQARMTTGSRTLEQSSSSNWNSFSSNTSLAGHPLRRHSPSGVPISGVHCQSHPKEVGPLFQQFTWWSSWQEDPHWLSRGWG